MSAREAALLTLVAMERQKAWSNGHLKKVIQEQRLDRRDAALATRLCFGVIQNRMLLDHYLQQYSAMKLSKMESKVRNNLRLGLYQMLFMTKIPVSAAVSEGVKLTKKHCKNPRAGGMVNGILRNLARHLDELPTLDRGNPVAYLSLLYSHPQWLVEEWSQQLEAGELEELLRWDNSEPPVTVQVNTCRFQTSQVAAALEEEGMTVTAHPWLPDCLVLTGTGDLTQGRAWQTGMFYPQDPAARLAVLAAGLLPGDKVLDACAAPGGKSLHMGDKMEGFGTVDARDVSQYKVDLIEENIHRAGAINVQAKVKDATVFDVDSECQADIVLADVPCSGYGVIGKKPEIKYRSTAQKQEELVILQRNILDKAAEYVKPRGVLIFSTCTIAKEENEENMMWFMNNHPFKLESIDEYIPDELKSETTALGYLQLLPGVHGTDGFFIARFRRK